VEEEVEEIVVIAEVVEVEVEEEVVVVVERDEVKKERKMNGHP